jgi:hypothetical protein
LHRFPDELVDLLSTMDEKTTNEAADLWSRSKDVPGNSDELSPVHDFFVAGPEDALQYESLVHAGNPLPQDRFERCEYKNFTPLALELLWAILCGKNGEARLRR